MCRSSTTMTMTYEACRTSPSLNFVFFRAHSLSLSTLVQCMINYMRVYVACVYVCGAMASFHCSHCLLNDKWRNISSFLKCKRKTKSILNKQHLYQMYDYEWTAKNPKHVGHFITFYWNWFMMQALSAIFTFCVFLQTRFTTIPLQGSVHRQRQH